MIDRGNRESELPCIPPGRGDDVAPGRKCISVVGINDYRRWPTLRNAVSDAEGVLAVFERLGFVPVVPPLIDGAATHAAISHLPVSLKSRLQWSDSLVVFFAGHGHTTTTLFPDGFADSLGYLIPVDAGHAGECRADDREDTWHETESWLSDIARLPARHVLVILDSCHSGIALGRPTIHRGRGVRTDGSSIPFDRRLGRWVLTSALGDQKAMDDGPIRGHSVFTGYLIQALNGDANIDRDASAVSVEEIAGYVRRRVLKHSYNRQAPDLGWLEHHNSGELLFWQPGVVPPPQPQPPGPGPEPTRSTSVNGSRPANGATPIKGPKRPSPRHAAAGRAKAAAAPRQEAQGSAQRIVDAMAHLIHEGDRVAERTEGWELDPHVAATLDWQGEQRRLGAHVLTVIAGDPMAAQTSWGTWAARHGHLILATQAIGLEGVVADLLAQTPWLRCVPEARKRVAAAAQIDEQAVDATLDSYGIPQQRAWIERVAPLDAHARVSGWILSSLRRATACVPDLATAPVGAAELLAIACDLASPTAMLLFHPTPDEQWLERAIVTAAELIPYLPTHSVAVTAHEALVSKMLAERRAGSAFTMARQGLVKVERDAVRIPGRARRSAMCALFAALARDSRTRGRFELDGMVRTPDGPAIDVEMVAHKARIAVELDAWYHFHDPEGYQRDRVQDMRLQRAGYFVLRFPAEDVDDRLASTVEQLAIALASRRAVRALP